MRIEYFVQRHNILMKPRLQPSIAVSRNRHLTNMLNMRLISLDIRRWTLSGYLTVGVFSLWLLYVRHHKRLSMTLRRARDACGRRTRLVHVCCLSWLRWIGWWQRWRWWSVGLRDKCIWAWSRVWRCRSTSRSLGRFEPELIGLPGKALARDASRRLLFVSHAAYWLHSIVFHGCSRCCN